MFNGRRPYTLCFLRCVRMDVTSETQLCKSMKRARASLLLKYDEYGRMISISQASVTLGASRNISSVASKEAIWSTNVVVND